MLTRRKNKPSMAVRRQDPVLSLQEEMNRVFDQFGRGWGLTPFTSELSAETGLWPQIDVSDNKKKVEVTAELPGMKADDVDITVSPSGDLLTISGNKREERKHEDDNIFRTERYFGSFRRDVALPAAVDPGSAEATYKDGVLHVSLGKRPEEEQAIKHIKVKAS